MEAHLQQADELNSKKAFTEAFDFLKVFHPLPLLQVRLLVVEKARGSEQADHPELLWRYARAHYDLSCGKRPLLTSLAFNAI